jgi:hypothetical protein
MLLRQRETSKGENPKMVYAARAARDIKRRKFKNDVCRSGSEGFFPEQNSLQ